ncbi:cytochrome P450 monooxygenase [Fomitopsis serialis]|uniref:cytochrome P450 monooxygenase n=1 Tax=Fomitopsis serialis TaxID=139415 RepID=UPI002007AEC8|nr:cytochrome P450 monooxygenase [Neoantrodia serialis]KAH9917085.1 cytochrome P450 monooxygenase [Neoantrodia serialis]
MLDSTAILTLAFFITAAYYALNGWYSRSQNLPPGPRPLPIIGNAHQMPLEYGEKTFAEWSSQYGDVIFVKVFHRPIILLNSARAVRDLMEKHSLKCSGRPPSVLLSELSGWGDVLAVMQMSERLRKHRRWLHSVLFAEGALDKFRSVQRREVDVLLASLLHAPDELTASLMMESIYGHTVTSDDDEYLHYAEAALKGTTEVASPGAAIVDILPFLRHIPSWMPGAGFKREAAKVKVSIEEAHVKPYEMVERAMAAGDEKPSLVRNLIDEYKHKATLAEERRDIMSAGAVSYIGARFQLSYPAGVDTTKTVLLNFILCAVLFPEAYTKAQEEIDRVVGTARLPDVPDREALPYLDCFLKEVYRWNCPVPLGVPHALSEDDEYRGWYIPKGCMVIPNLWLMTVDEEVYPEPSAFRPERFLGLSGEEAEQLDPRNIVFGHGRRICPGRRFADVSVWLAVANIVAAFDIRKARDAGGKEITPPLSFVPGAVRCLITPRMQATDILAGLSLS